MHSAGFRLLLANMAAPPSLFNPASPFTYRFPLTLNTLKAAVDKAHGGAVETVLCDRQHDSGPERLIELVRSGRFDLVGLSVPFGHEAEARTILDRLSEFFPAGEGPRIVLGNALPTYRAERFLADYPAVHVVCGEGEYALPALIDCLLFGADLGRVPNLASVREGAVRVNPSVPVRGEDFVVPATLGLCETVAAGGIVQLEASRGCSWGKCTFCNRFRLCGGWRPFPTQTVVETLARFEAQGASHVVFADEDFFGGDLERSVELAEAVLASGVGLRSWVSAKVQDVASRHDTTAQRQLRERCLMLFRRAGVETVFLGIESGVASQLRRYGKPLTPGESARAVALLRDLGFEVVCGFIMFDPFVTLAEIAENLEFLERAGLEQKTYIFNSVNICEHNGHLRRRVEEAGLTDGLAPDGVYQRWRFADPDVAELAGIARAWVGARQVYNELLAPAGPGAPGGEGGLQPSFRELQKTIRAFDLAFFKLLLLSFAEVGDPGAFLANLGGLGFTRRERNGLAALVGDFRTHRGTPRSPERLKGILEPVLAKRELRCLQVLASGTGHRVAAEDRLKDVMTREAEAVLAGCMRQAEVGLKECAV